ncbi:dipeptidyl peptidase IV protein [Necator americanus]|uniref:Dipeptidyl peptidase IV protein n=1 Tax=Necator americanus TaxID=51031 RepID=W2TH77_NECAM|nr:dipeptidyl peptidase IV protein [Necator americanus]ETN81183.1 dipeptidyl peptidase IV protein [Necator americanus]
MDIEKFFKTDLITDDKRFCLTDVAVVSKFHTGSDLLRLKEREAIKQDLKERIVEVLAEAGQTRKIRYACREFANQKKRRQFPVSFPSLNSSTKNSQKAFGNRFVATVVVEQKRKESGGDKVYHGLPQPVNYGAHFVGDDAIVYSNYLHGPVRLSLDRMEPERLLKYNPVFWQDGHLYYSESPESLTSVRISIEGLNRQHEISERSYGVWWSKRGKKLAFLSKEKKEEKSILMVGYTEGESYPSVMEQKYAKTHEKQIPTFILFVWDKGSRELKQMDVQLRNRTAYHIFYGAEWVVIGDEEFLVVFWADRLQTHISVTICDHPSGFCKLIFEHKYPSRTWPEVREFSSILSSDNAIYILLPRARADGNSYQHIAKLTIQRTAGKGARAMKWAKSSFLSIGNFDVVKLNAYDKNNDTIYFTASAPSPLNRHLYSTMGSPGPAVPRYYLGDIVGGKVENCEV